MVAASSIVEGLVTPVGGCGTVVALVTGLWAWSILAKAASSTYLSNSPLIILGISAMLNVLIYGIFGEGIAAVARKLGERPQAVAWVAWAFAYAALLLWAFPATDCP